MTTRQLPALHEGHAPVMLHGAFDEALEAYQDWAPGADEPQVEFEGRLVPISSVFGRMRTCTDILPWRVQSDVSALMGGASIGNGEKSTTYADAAILLRSICVERLRKAMQ
ncbi:hypothetical protein [Mesorhizobium sp.]|uniref:hypothetical protein n=1 Tax=Mesorhizobium sp. TaxID=1871066 RepID=UPI000FE54295|nr:hypothetical protein [Mesorhizobium sp.]RWD92220.1 MAG: hypothetical protein EOS39_15585 [Mesorhizobium sp.]TIV50624.1 MAG: hypothetical protein E5V88_19760 [Mesorhizobium sp.]